jgi:hypothetical protein
MTDRQAARRRRKAGGRRPKRYDDSVARPSRQGFSLSHLSRVEDIVRSIKDTRRFVKKAFVRL